MIPVRVGHHVWRQILIQRGILPTSKYSLAMGYGDNYIDDHLGSDCWDLHQLPEERRWSCFLLNYLQVKRSLFGLPICAPCISMGELDVAEHLLQHFLEMHRAQVVCHTASSSVEHGTLLLAITMSPRGQTPTDHLVIPILFIGRGYLVTGISI